MRASHPAQASPASGCSGRTAHAPLLPASSSHAGPGDGCEGDSCSEQAQARLGDSRSAPGQRHEQRPDRPLTPSCTGAQCQSSVLERPWLNQGLAGSHPRPCPTEEHRPRPCSAPRASTKPGARAPRSPSAMAVLPLRTDSRTLTQITVHAARLGADAHPDGVKFQLTPPGNMSHTAGPLLGLDRC